MKSATRREPRARPGRRVVLLAALAALVVGVGVATGWREIATRYHLVRLRGDVAYLDDLLDAPPESPGRAALRRYAGGEAGAEVVLVKLVELLEKPVASRTIDTGQVVVTGQGAVTRFRVAPSVSRMVDPPLRSILRSLSLAGAAFVTTGGDRSGTEIAMSTRSHGSTARRHAVTFPGARLRTLFELLDDLPAAARGSPWRVAAYPRLRLEMMPAEDVDEAHNLVLGDVSSAAALTPALVVRTGPEVVPPLLAAFSGGSGTADALAAHGVDRPALLAIALGRFDPTRLPWWDDAEPELRAELLDVVRAVGPWGGFAVNTLAVLREYDPELLGLLERLLGHAETSVRAETAYLFPFFGPAADQALPRLLEVAATDPVPYVRRAALRGAGSVATPRVATSADAALELLGDRDAVIRARAAIVLGEMRASRPDVIEALVGRLEDPEPRVRFRAAQALGDIGPAAKHALAALEMRLGDPDGLVSLHARRAIEKIAGDRVDRKDGRPVGR